jgi:hypothetical protein
VISLRETVVVISLRCLRSDWSIPIYWVFRLVEIYLNVPPYVPKSLVSWN